MPYFVGFFCGVVFCVLLYSRMPRTSLPNDVESLQKLLHAAEEKLQSLSAQLRSRDVLIEKMRLELAHLKRMKFGRSSEQLDEKIAQLEFSLEELEANEAAMPTSPASVAEHRRRPMRYTLAAEGRHQLPHIADRQCEDHDARHHGGAAQQRFIECLVQF